MKRAKMEDMQRGWFVGDFDPAIYRTGVAEVCYLIHRAGERPRPHHHRIATEITAVVRGRVEINGEIFQTGDIFLVEPGESVSPVILEDTEVIVVKVPSVPGDKYFDDIDSAQGEQVRSMAESRESARIRTPSISCRLHKNCFYSGK